jgi:hypothetical protein
MKKLVKFSTLMLIGALIFAGCKKDEPTNNYAADVEGAYNGEIKMGESIVTSDATLTLTRTANDKVTVAMNESIETPTGNLPLDVNFPATVAKSGDDYTINGNGKVMLPTGYGVVESDVTFSGTISPNGTAIFDINVSTIGIGVTVKFIGARIQE